MLGDLFRLLMMVDYWLLMVCFRFGGREVFRLVMMLVIVLVCLRVLVGILDVGFRFSVLVLFSLDL